MAAMSSLVVLLADLVEKHEIGAASRGRLEFGATSLYRPPLLRMDRPPARWPCGSYSAVGARHEPGECEECLARQGAVLGGVEDAAPARRRHEDARQDQELRLAVLAGDDDARPRGTSTCGSRTRPASAALPAERGHVAGGVALPGHEGGCRVRRRPPCSRGSGCGPGGAARSAGRCCPCRLDFQEAFRKGHLCVPVTQASGSRRTVGAIPDEGSHAIVNALTQIVISA